MLRGNLGYKKITEDIDNFSLEGMVEPTFYNFGGGDVRVYDTVVKPGESFLAGCHNMVMEGEIPVVFLDDSKHDLKVYFGRLIKVCIKNYYGKAEFSRVNRMVGPQ